MTRRSDGGGIPLGIRHVSWRRGFATRLAVTISVLIVVSCLALAWIVTKYSLAQLRQTLSVRGRAVAEHLARDAELGVLSGDVESLHRLAVSTRMEADVVYCKVLDGNGRLLTSAGDLPLGTRPSPPPGPDSAAEPPGLDERVWEFLVPVLTTNTRPQREEIEFLGQDRAGKKPSGAKRQIGSAVVGISLERMEAMRRQVLVTAMSFTALVALVAVFSAVLIAKAMTRPLLALADAAESIASGNLDTTVPVQTRDEVGALAHTFNVMAFSLAGSRVTLEEYNRTLEEKVRARTERLEELNRQLREADRLKSEFLATVSHELRTPLNVIMGYTEMLLDEAGGPITNDQYGMIEAIRRYSKQQLDLVTNVLDFSRLASGKVSLHVERFGLEPVLADVLAPHFARLSQRAIGLSLYVPPDLPELETDRVKLQEIARNIIDNAVKFTVTGSIAVTARIDPGADRILIDVQDTGSGIPAEALSHVFEPFLQLGESSTRGTGGVGLGLSIAKQLVDVMGGTVSVWSRFGEGSTFRIDIPRCITAAGTGTAIAATGGTSVDGPTTERDTHAGAGGKETGASAAA